MKNTYPLRALHVMAAVAAGCHLQRKTTARVENAQGIDIAG
jgi:hypothetical protein